MIFAASNTMTSKEDILPSIIFCDLDGTLVLDNSFHVFLSVAWKKSSFPLRIGLVSRMGPRLFGHIFGGHEGLKRRVLAWVSERSESWKSAVVSETLSRLQPTISAPIMLALKKWQQEGAQIVLATAAPELYARPLTERIGAMCLATSSHVDKNWCELVSNRKAEACKKLMEDLSEDSKGGIYVLTDHIDDIPILRMADKVIIQAPLHEFNSIVTNLVDVGEYCPTVEHIDPTGEEKGGAYWLWIDDRPMGPSDAWEVRTVLSKHRHALLYSGNGLWRRIGPGESLEPSALRFNCPSPPSSRVRLITHLRRRLFRDWLRIFH